MPLLTQNRAGENARERRQRAGRRARGVCTVCGAAKDDPARNLCATCRHHARERTARYRQTGREAEVIRLRESLAVRGGSTFSELRWYPPVEAAKGSLSWVFRAKQPESVRTGP